MIEIKNLTKQYGPKKALSDLSLTIRQGRSLAFWDTTEQGSRPRSKA